MVTLTVSACRHRGQLGKCLAGVRLHRAGSVTAGFQAHPHGSLLQEWVWVLSSSALLLPEFCCFRLKILTAAICSKGSWGRKRKEAKKKRMLAPECLSCVFVHKTTWKGDRKRSESRKMFDLYLAAPFKMESSHFSNRLAGVCKVWLLKPLIMCPNWTLTCSGNIFSLKSVYGACEFSASYIL